jgi:hypothetical protein
MGMKLATNYWHRSLQEVSNLGCRFISRVQAASLRAIVNQLAMTRWCLRAAWTATM